MARVTVRDEAQRKKEEEQHYDWEDDHLSVAGFVTDYIQWRLEQAEMEWYDAPLIMNGAEKEHEAMRAMCAMFEEINREELDQNVGELMTYQHLTFAKYREVMNMFCDSEGDKEDTFTYGRLVGLLTFAGLVSLEYAQRDYRREITQVALYTSRFVDHQIRATWKSGERSWAKFLTWSTSFLSRSSTSPSTLSPVPLKRSSAPRSLSPITLAKPPPHNSSLPNSTVPSEPSEPSSPTLSTASCSLPEPVTAVGSPEASPAAAVTPIDDTVPTSKRSGRRSSLMIGAAAVLGVGVIVAIKTMLKR